MRRIIILIAIAMLSPLIPRGFLKAFQVPKLSWSRICFSSIIRPSRLLREINSCLFPMTKKGLKLYARLKYHNHSSNATVKIRQRLLPQDDPPPRLPSLAIKFDLHTHHQYWSSPEQLEHEHSRTNSLHLQIWSTTSPLFDTSLHTAMEKYLDNWGEEFDRNYSHVILHDMIGKVNEIIDDECNKDRLHLDVRVRVKLVVHHSSSMLLLVKNMEVDENAMNDDCIICLEKLGKERELMCMPCSHRFHGDCLTTWLENGDSCPVCRYDLLDT